MTSKKILDACCGARSMWFNKNHPAALYMDNRKEEKGFIIDRPHFEINPDILADFKAAPFPDKKFKLIVWDPPHLRNLDKKSWIFKKYGKLGPNWKKDLKKGFDSLWRCLADDGILIFKWSSSHDNRPNRDVKVRDVLDLFAVEPLFGHTTGKNGNTFWMCFMKIKTERGLT